jgi:hypothetical protein
VHIPDEADQRSGVMSILVDHDSGLKPIRVPGESDHVSAAKPISARLWPEG